MRYFIRDFEAEHGRVDGRKLRVIVAGDFNVDMSRHEKIVEYEQQKKELAESEEYAAKIEFLDDMIEIAKHREHHLKYIDIPRAISDGFRKINSCEPTFYIESYGAIDQVMVNFEVDNVEEEILGKEQCLSDHYLVLQHFDGLC